MRVRKDEGGNLKMEEKRRMKAENSKGARGKGVLILLVIVILISRPMCEKEDV